MIDSIDCPESVRLRDLLDNMLPESDLALVTRHLDDCPHCQQQLETLATDGEFPGDVRQLGRWRVEAGPGLHRAMAELTGGLAQSEIDTRPEVPLDEPILNFLTPSGHPGSLGRFGDHEVQEVLGHGGMGVVLRAFDPGLNRVVALKVLAPQLAASGAARKRFAREARAAAAVCHENVVAIHAVDVAQGLPFIVMEYVSGQSLEQRLRSDTPLRLEEILEISLQTARGLAAAHARGLIHRDVKPANILLAAEARGKRQEARKDDSDLPLASGLLPLCKLTDFGLARTIDDGTVTQSGFLPGTPAYMAPEQAGGESVDHRADLFSLGSVIYAMCTGRPPFSASTLFALLRRVSEEEPIPAETITPSLPRWLVAIMKRLHAKKPEERFQSATEVVGVLEQCLEHVRQPARAPLPWFLRDLDRPPRRVRVRSWLAVALLLLTLGGLGLWAAGVFRLRTPEGTLVVEVSDPKVSVTVDGQDVTISGEGIAETRLRAGRYKVDVNKEGKPVATRIVEIKKDGREVVRVSLEPATDRPAPGVPSKPASAPLILSGHSGAIRSLIFSPDGRLLVSGGGDKTIRVWDVVTGKQLRVHEKMGPVVAISFFPDGKVLVTVADDGTIQLWDVATGKVLSQIKLPGMIKLSAVESNGKVMASINDGNLSVVDLFSGVQRGAMPVNQDVVWYALALSPDAQNVAAAREGEVVFWDVESGKARTHLLQRDKRIRSLSYTPDGQKILVLSDDGLRVWDPNTGKTLLQDYYRVLGRATRPTAMIHSPDGKHLATADSEGMVRVIRVADGVVVFEHQEKARPIAILVFSPDGKRLAWATPEGAIRLTVFDAWKADGDRLREEIRKLNQRLAEVTEQLNVARDEAERERYRAEMERANALLREQKANENAMLQRQRAEQEAQTARRMLYYRQLNQAADGWKKGEAKDTLKLLEAIPRDQRQWEWNYLRTVLGGQEQSRRLAGHAAAVRSLAVAPDGKRFASGGDDGTLRVWEPNGNAVLLASPHKDGIDGISFSRDGRQLASTGRDGKLSVLDAANGRTVFTFTRDDHGPSALAYSPDNKLLAWKNHLCAVELIDTATGKTVNQIGEPKAKVNSLTYNPNNTLLCMAGEGLSPTLYNPVSGATVRVLAVAGKDAEANHRNAAFSPDGKQLLSVGQDSGIVRLWDVPTGKLLTTMRGHPAPVCATFSPDGRRIATGGGDNKVKVWDLATGQSLLTLTGHTKPVTCVAFTPDGASLISGSLDQTLRVWPGNQAK